MEKGSPETLLPIFHQQLYKTEGCMQITAKSLGIQKDLAYLLIVLPPDHT